MLSKIECNGNDRSVAQSASLLFAVQRDSLISPWLSSNDKKKKKIRLLELAWIELYGNMDETAVDEKGR